MAIKITLRDEKGNEQSYKAPRVRGRMLRETFKLNAKLTQDGVIGEDTLDEMVEHVCDVFDNQFSVDDFYDGLYGDEILTEIQNVLKAVINPDGNSGGAKN